VSLHSHTGLTGIASGKSYQVNGEESGHAVGDNSLQTEQVMVEIALLFPHPSPSSCGNNAHEFVAREQVPKHFPSKIRCRKRENKSLGGARAEHGDGVCNNTAASTQVFPQIRSNWGITNLRCRPTGEHLTWLLLSNGPYTGGVKAPMQKPIPAFCGEGNCGTMGTMSRKIRG